MNIGHSKSYDRLAVAAGRQVGLKKPTAKAVEKDEAARARRDVLWAEYERRLRDTHTWSLADLRTWLGEHGVKVSTATVDRNRRRVLDSDRLLVLANARTRECMDLMKDTSESDVLEAARKRAGQILFDLFVRLPAEALEALKPGQILKAFEVAGRLSTAHGQAELMNQRLAQMRREFDKKVRTAQRRTKDGRLSQSEIDEISEAVFGSAAA